MFLNGINHVFLHGSTYSPESADWPGWKFYASVNFNDSNPIWEDASAYLNTSADHSHYYNKGSTTTMLLVYWPVHDSWAKFNQGKLLVQFAIHRLDTWLSGTPFYETVHHLINEGYSIDYVSDRFLKKLMLKMGSFNYRGKLPLDHCSSFPTHALENFEKLVALRTMGASGCLWEPKSVPGFFEFKEGAGT